MLCCWLFFISLLSLWKALPITANRRCIYPCRLQGCQLPVQPGKPNAGSAPPLGLTGGAALETNPKLFLSFLWHSHGSASSRHVSCQVAGWFWQPPGPTQDALGGVAVGSQVSGCFGGSPGCWRRQNSCWTVRPRWVASHPPGCTFLSCRFWCCWRAKVGITHPTLSSTHSLRTVCVCLRAAGEGDFLKMDCSWETTSVGGKAYLPAFSHRILEVGKKPWINRFN